MKKKLLKSNKDIVVSGTLAGIGEYLKIYPTIVRVLFILSLFFSWGTSLLIYIIMVIVVPSQKIDNSNFNQQYGNADAKKPRKEAERVDDDEWSDY